MDNFNTSLNECRSCKSNSLGIESSRDKFPLYIWPLPKEETTPLVNLNVYICNDCGFMQLQNINDEMIAHIYRDEAFNIENIDQKIERLNLITKDKKKKFKNVKVLEVGGGRNTFLGILPDSSEKWVTDFSVEENVKSIVKGSLEGDFVDIEFPQQNFDYIFMFHVLEHFNNPGGALEKAKKLLNNDGKIIIEVPNFNYESEIRPDYTLFHMHISLFSQTSLISLMMRYGFICSNLYKEDEVLLAEFKLNYSLLPKNHRDHSLEYLKKVDLNIDKCGRKLKTIFKEIDNEKVAIFGGGGAATLFLYNYSFLIDHIQFAIDNSEEKFNRFLCNGRVKIVNPKEIMNLNIQHILVLDNAHTKYLENKEINFIKIGDIYES